MKKIVFIVAGCLFFTLAFSQDSTFTTTATKAANTKTIQLPNRPGDHLMIQLSSDHWSGMPDSISSHQSGFSRGFNAYFMLDKPFRNSPKYSIGFGLGISTSNITFKKMEVDLKAPSTLIPFRALDSTNHFKKYKLATSYLEVPLEFRLTSKPSNVNKSFKAALGVKVGTLINAHTKGKALQDKNNNLTNSYTEKENSKRFINGTRFTATGRIGYGILSLFGTYQLNNVLKDGAGPDMKLYQIGLTLSGL
ncbi:MAG: outer membrane beta-barrel protein [Ginsengibacter sp.]